MKKIILGKNNNLKKIIYLLRENEKKFFQF